MQIGMIDGIRQLGRMAVGAPATFDDKQNLIRAEVVPNLGAICFLLKTRGKKLGHDHPRWSITICLKGQLIERTPWSERTLAPGSIVIRSRKAIHAFRVEPEFRGKTWTLFIVGRRNYAQNRYTIQHKGVGSMNGR